MDPNTLVYAKLAYYYAGATLHFADGPVRFRVKENLDNFAYGIALKHALDKGFYVGAELHRVDYSSLNYAYQGVASYRVAPKQIQTLVTLGYVF